MSKWFDLSANANKLRQSYLKGFLDISGGWLYMRSDNSLNFYTTADESVPKLALDATKIRAFGKQYASEADGYHDLNVSKLGYLKDIDENVQLQLDNLDFRTKYISSDTSNSDPDTIIHMQKEVDDANNVITVTGHIVPKTGEMYDLGSAEKPFNALYLKKNTIYFDDSTSGLPP